MTNVSNVDVVKPPITVIANPFEIKAAETDSTSADIASGINAHMVATAVMTIGLNLDSNLA